MNEQVLYQIGKKGINENAAKDISDHLLKGKFVRVKFLRSFLGITSRHEAAEKLLGMIKVRNEHRLVGNVLQLKKK